MPSPDTISFRITKKTHEELGKIRKIISEELGVDINMVTYKHAEITMRLMASRGKAQINEFKDIILGKIK